ncbi:MAG: D-inositol-3-phosphate glycosyltransferase [Peptostreptococcus russellii]
MKNIYIFDEFISSSINGIGTYLEELISIFENSDYKINVIRFNYEDKEFSESHGLSANYFNIPTFPDKSFFKHHSIIAKLLYLHITDCYDNIFILNHTQSENLIVSIKEYFPKSKVVCIIHGQEWCSELLGNTELLYKIIKERNYKVQNNTYNDVISGFQREQKMYQLADHIICLSEDSLNLLTNLYNIPINKTTLIHNGLRDITYLNIENYKNVIRHEYVINEDENILIYAGRINREKGVYNLISAIQNVLFFTNNVRLLIAGPLSSPDIIHYSSKICCKISYCGYLPKNELYKLYSIANIGVLPSYIEQCSYTGIEMLMHGLPIITTNCPGNRSMFCHNHNALVSEIDYSTGNEDLIKSLSRNILSLLNDHDLCKRLSIAARNSYLKRYSISIMKEKYLRLFNSL